MTLTVGKVSNATRQFADIREITELAAENRRRGGADDDRPLIRSGSDQGARAVAAWCSPVLASE